jgi:hypothetical protein
MNVNSYANESLILLSQVFGYAKPYIMKCFFGIDLKVMMRGG